MLLQVITNIHPPTAKGNGTGETTTGSASDEPPTNRYDRELHLHCDSSWPTAGAATVWSWRRGMQVT